MYGQLCNVEAVFNQENHSVVSDILVSHDHMVQKCAISRYLLHSNVRYFGVAHVQVGQLVAARKGRHSGIG